MPLFSAFLPDSGGERLVAAGGDVRLYRGWLPGPQADALLASIRLTTEWRQERRVMYDRTVDVPREQAWFGDAEFGGRPFTPELEAVRAALEELTGAGFRHVLLNRYRTGADSVAWHSDRSGAGGAQPVIGSLTLGATRAFDLRPKADRARVISVDLDHGDLLVMRGETQTGWEHRVGKDPRISGERINLTFRQRPETDPGSKVGIEQEFDSGSRRGELR